MKDIEIEKKFLIRFPDEAFLQSLPGCECTVIEQIYLADSGSGFYERIRKRGSSGNYKYYHTKKRHITGMKRIEKEYLITEDKYIELKKNADPKLNAIYKKRYCIPYMGHTLEIDVFPFWRKQAYLEIELESENEQYQLPDYIEIIKDVTWEGAYTNRALAREIPAED